LSSFSEHFFHLVAAPFFSLSFWSLLVTHGRYFLKFILYFLSVLLQTSSFFSVFVSIEFISEFQSCLSAGQQLLQSSFGPFISAFVSPCFLISA